jgi:hypothetical protein
MFMLASKVRLNDSANVCSCKALAVLHTVLRTFSKNIYPPGVLKCKHWMFIQRLASLSSQANFKERGGGSKLSGSTRPSRRQKKPRCPTSSDVCLTTPHTNVRIVKGKYWNVWIRVYRVEGWLAACAGVGVGWGRSGGSPPTTHPHQRHEPRIVLPLL